MEQNMENEIEATICFIVSGFSVCDLIFQA